MGSFENFEQFLEAYLKTKPNAPQRTEEELAATIAAVNDAGKLPEFIADRRGL